MNESMLISSAQNERFNSLLALREKKARSARQTFIVEGEKEIELAQKNGFIVEELWLTHPQILQNEKLKSDNAAVYQIPETLYKKVGYREKTEGIMAVIHMKPLSLDSLIVPESALIIVADHLEKPGNIGTLFRIADGAGAVAVVLVGLSSDAYNPNVVRNSVGTFFSVPFVVTEPDTVLAWLLAKKLIPVVTTPAARQSYPKFDWPKRTALIVGREHEGVQSNWGKAALHVSVPMRGQNDSLNVAVSTGILAYDWAKANP